MGKMGEERFQIRMPMGENHVWKRVCDVLRHGNQLTLEIKSGKELIQIPWEELQNQMKRADEALR